MPPKPKAQPRRQPTRGAAKAQTEDTANEIPPNEAVAEDVDMTDEVSAASEEIPPEPTTPRLLLESTAKPVSPPAQKAAQPTKRPVQRLTSLNSRSSASGASGTRPAGSLKFQPKSFIRRSKEEREAQERAEAERRRARLAAAETSSSAATQRGGFNGRGAGRGSFSGGMNKWNSMRYSGGQASGHLGGGTVGEGARKKRPGLGSLFSGASTSTSKGSSTSRVKHEPTPKSERDKDGDVVMVATRTRPTVKKEESGLNYISSEEEFDSTGGPRVNIEHINLISDEDTEDDKPKETRQKQPRRLGRDPKVHISGLKPVRIDRHEHIERAVGVNTEASSTTMAEFRRKAKERALAEGGLFLSENEAEITKIPKAKGKGKAKDVEFVKDERKWQGVWSDEEDIHSIPRIKEEPGDDIDPMMIDGAESRALTASDVAKIAHQLSSPKTSRKVEKLPLRRKHKRRRTTRSRTQKPVLQTAEDRQEWARYQEDLYILTEELGPRTTTIPPVATGISTDAEEGDDKADTDTKNETKRDRKQGLVYLFQLPPIIPSLITPTEKEESEAVAAKQLSPPPAKPEQQPSASSMPPPPGNPFSAPHKTHPKIKPDPDSKPTLTSTTPISASLGKAGKITVLATGRVIATWGGVGIEVGRGGEGGILQEVVLWEVGMKGAEAMGQVAGGFVGVPELGRMVGKKPAKGKMSGGQDG